MLTTRLNIAARLQLLRSCSTTLVGKQKETAAAAAALESHDPLQAHAMKEQCILVDEQDKAIGAASKADCHRVDPETNSLKLHRAFSVFLFNTKGEMLIQRRSLQKITFPDTYTNACCSHPLHDIEQERLESNAQGVRLAAQRRLNYELGIPTEEIQPEDFHYLTRIHYAHPGDGIWGEHEIDYILFLKKDVTLKPNDNEVSEVRYLKRAEIDDVVSKFNAPMTPWFELILRHRLKQWWDNLHKLHKFEDLQKIQRF
ncbi:isopentenyl-diphosphate Delta-isomerase 1 [Drosophila nasuta]|uniref:isopentenyl-diphosphate Delta-isomerase n=1 Tax=Drosophila albomicans TaxID=7291 RepID=A0A6P8XR70_DROAB|nr:isopentenyl-diphosphate Delta-isomerase 1 [Drosophila albomicans]XP_060650156.1 isopentenyl-diphosphate Delta-isomerase 1 [Drosophila nasuta]